MIRRAPGFAVFCRLTDLVVCLALCLTLAGCHPQADPHSLYPLDTGLHWTYRVITRRHGQKPENSHRSVTVIGTTTLANGSQATIRRYNDGQRYYETKRRHGFYRLAYKPLLAHAPIADQPAIPILPLPARKGRTWQAAAHTYLLTRAAVFISQNTPNHTVVLDYRITNTHATVDVPAGRFTHCVAAVGRATFHLDQSTGFAAADIPVVQREWFCPGVGLARLSRGEKITSRQKTITGGRIDMVLSAYSD